MFWLASMVRMYEGLSRHCILNTSAYRKIGAKNPNLNGETYLVLSGEFEFR